MQKFCQPPRSELVFLRSEGENNKLKHTRIIKESSQLCSVWAQEVQRLMQNFHNAEYWTGPQSGPVNRTDRGG